MNKRAARVLKRQASREVREKLGSEMQLLREVFKPRPRWVPRWLWEFGLSIFVYSGDFEFRPWRSEKPAGGNQIDV